MSGTDFPTVLFLVALLGNVIGIVLAGLVTVNRSRAALHAAALVFPLAWLAHLGAIVNTALAGGRLLLSNVTEYLLMLGWFVLSLHLFVWFRLKVRVAGLVLPPVAALATLVAWLAGPGQPGPAAELPPVWFLFHVSVSTLGMATLCVSFAMSVLYLVQDRALKTKKALGLLERFPALERCDKIGFQALVSGFVLLTVGIGTGAVVSSRVHEQLLVLGTKQGLVLLAWVVFAAIIASRFVLGFRGRKSAYLTITGFALGLLSVIGMTL